MSTVTLGSVESVMRVLRGFVCRYVCTNCLVCAVSVCFVLLVLAAPSSFAWHYGKNKCRNAIYLYPASGAVITVCW